MSSRLIYIFILIFVCQTSSFSQRSKYYSYLSSTQEEEYPVDFDPSIFAASDGGFFLAENGIYSAIKVTKFDQLGQIKWSKVIKYVCDGLHFNALKEAKDGSIFVLATADWSRNIRDAVLFKLKPNGDELFNLYVTPESIEVPNLPINFEFDGENVFIYGIYYKLTFVDLPFFAIINQSGKTTKFKNWHLPKFNPNNFQLLSKDSNHLLFLTLFADTGKVYKSKILGLSNYIFEKDTFEYCALIDSAGFVIKTDDLINPLGTLEIGCAYHNKYDSTFLLTFSHPGSVILNEENEYHLYKIDSKGKVLVNKLLKRLNPNDTQTFQIELITARSAESIQVLAYFDAKGGGEPPKSFLVNFNSKLEETSRSLFFLESKEFKQYLMDNRIKYYFYQNYLTIAQTTFIYDNEGNAIFCIEVSNMDLDNFSKILIVKLNSNGELVSLNQVSKFSIDSYNIYPNPFKDLVTVNLKEECNYELQVFDIMGYLVKSLQASGITNINFSDLEPGVYNLIISETNSSKKTRQKIIKHY